MGGSQCLIVSHIACLKSVLVRVVCDLLLDSSGIWLRFERNASEEILKLQNTISSDELLLAWVNSHCGGTPALLRMQF